MVHALTPVLKRQGRVDLCEFKARLVYKASSPEQPGMLYDKRNYLKIKGCKTNKKE